MTDLADLDPRTAAAIAAGMLAVALADGSVHPRELALIRSYQDDLPDDVDPSGVRITDPATLEILVRSLLLTALADGHISAQEATVIDEIARSHGMSREDLAALSHTVRAELVEELGGMALSRAAIHALAGDLELEVTEVEAHLTSKG